MALLAGVLFAGCESMPSTLTLPAHYHPANVYRNGESLDPLLKRVALLPLAPGGAADSLGDGIETLQPLVAAEVSKTRRFEVIPVSPEQLRQWTGQTTWRADEPLPMDLFEKLRKSTGCDAVLFCQLTRFQAYQPLVVGWKLSLVQFQAAASTVSASTAPPVTRIVWSADDILDAGNRTVSQAARWYYLQQQRDGGPAPDPAVILNSPARFGQFTLGTLLATLPAR